MVLQKMAPKSSQIFITFSDTFDVLMLCTKFESIPTTNSEVMIILKKLKKQRLYILYPCFFQKMTPKLPQIFITFSDTH